MRGHVISPFAWACKSTLRVNTSRHVISGTRPSRLLFLHGCEIKAGVGRTGNEATHVLYQLVCLECNYLGIKACEVEQE